MMLPGEYTQHLIDTQGAEQTPPAHPAPPTAQENAKNAQTAEACAAIVQHQFCVDYPTAAGLKFLFTEQIEYRVQDAIAAERDRCRRACVSEMGGKTFGEIKKVQAVEKKIVDGWEGE